MHSVLSFIFYMLLEKYQWKAYRQHTSVVYF
jgi:hypothetical protein